MNAHGRRGVRRQIDRLRDASEQARLITESHREALRAVQAELAEVVAQRERLVDHAVVMVGWLVQASDQIDDLQAMLDRELARGYEMGERAFNDGVRDADEIDRLKRQLEAIEPPAALRRRLAEKTKQIAERDRRIQVLEDELGTWRSGRSLTFHARRA
jgi:chromosome segregation ATPase